MTNALCLQVSKSQGQNAIGILNKLGLIDKSLCIQRSENELLIPLSRQLEAAELQTLRVQVPNAQLTTCDFETSRLPEKQTIAEVLEGDLPPNLLSSLPHSLDVIGDIAIVEIPSELKPHETLIGKAILRMHRSVKAVFSKASAISGTFRVRDLTFIGGEERTTTTYCEFGCQYHVDVAKVYFSPRLSHEHQRVSMQVQPGEVVVDLFAGVGPFAVLIGKTCNAAKVFAVDINPDAVELLKTNVRVNRVEGKVYPILGDARQLTATSLRVVADRVIMNLPETAIDFVDAACQTLKRSGGVIHFYGFVRKPDTIEQLKLRFSSSVEKANRKVARFLYAKSVRETAPFEAQVVLDAEIV